MSTKSPASRYMAHLATYKAKYKDWLSRAEKIDRRYRDAERMDDSPSKRFNILWSNVQTIKPALYSRMPQPDVSRRYRDSDPVGRLAANILERCLEFEIQHYQDYGTTLTQCVYDRLLGGRGTCWIRFEPHFMASPGENEDGEQITEDADESGNEPAETIEYECAPVDYVNWEDFGHNVARTWEEVTIVWRRAYMSRAAMVKRFGAKGKKVPLDATGEDDKSKSNGDDEQEFRGRVLEFWDRDSRMVTWLAEADGTLLETRDDPLRLEGFFPCPKPLYATLTNKSLIPTPDFALYQDQAMDLDLLATRKSGLADALQVKGVCSAGVPGISAMLKSAGNLDILEISNWAAFAEKGGMKGALELFDLSMISGALQQTSLAMAAAKQDIYEITGISDIVRGQGDANATATAERIKGQYAGLRLRDLQKSVAEFATEILRLKGEIICKHFSAQSILQMSGAEQMPPSEIFPPEIAEQVEMMKAQGQLVPIEQSLIPQAIQMLKSDPMRKFRVEIVADTLVQLDEEAEKEDTSEFLTAVGGYLSNAAKIIPAAPTTAPVLIGLLQWGVRRFKLGKTIEGLFDELAMQARKQAQQPAPDPEQMRQQIEQEATQKVQIHNAAKENALNKRASDLDIREVKLEGARQLFEMEVNNVRDQMDRKAQVQDMTLRRAGAEADARVTESVRSQQEDTNKAAGEAVKTIRAMVEEVKDLVGETLGKNGAGAVELVERMEAIARMMSAPRKRTLVRGPDGRIAGAVETVETETI